MKIAHARAVLVALPVWFYSLVWLWPRAARAESRLSPQFWTFDWASLGYACMLGLLGGGLALIVALASDRRVVVEVLKESARNAMVSPIAGAAAYLVLKGAAAMNWFVLSTEPRFLVIVASGWAGIAFFQWVLNLVGAGAGQVRDGLIDLALAWLQRSKPGARPPSQE
jgi:hypothetical protein